MKLLYFLLCVTYVSCYYTDVSPAGKERIVGGDTEAVENVPYQASVEKNNKLLCGATILSRLWLLSIASCLIGLYKPIGSVKIRTGTAFRETNGNVYDLKYIKYYDDYLDNAPDTDLVLLGAIMQFNEYTDAIRMVTSPGDPPVGVPMEISGFGKTDQFNKDFSPVLRKAVVITEPRDLCKNYLVSPNMFCATSHRNDKCHGDFGGPAVIDKKLAGIIAPGTNCAQRYYPGFYLNVGEFYPWIKDITGIKYDVA